MYTASRFVLGTWEGNLIIAGVLALASHEGRHLIFIYLFIFNIYF